MTIFPTETGSTLGHKVAEFARRHIAPRTDLHRENRFPMEIWRAMGRKGLLGLTISKAYGGMGGTSTDLALALFNLTKEGHNLGLALSFLIHHIVAHNVIEARANDQQKERYLPHLAQGLQTACLAVSEPQKGAHPKHLTSNVTEDMGGYRITGEKTYLTNGPIADLFVVVAVSNRVSERKGFSALIIPRDLSGLEVLPPLDIPFFRPAPHGGIRFKDLEVTWDALLGTKENAYEKIVLPVRRIEEVLMMAAVSGLLEKKTKLLAEAAKTRGNNAMDEEVSLKFGQLKAMSDTAKTLSFTAAQMLDASPPCPELTSLPLFFQHIVADFHPLAGRLQDHLRCPPSDLFRVLSKQLRTLTRIGRQGAKSKLHKLGYSLLKPSDEGHSG